MADVSLVLGESGSGKSRSIINLPAKHTFLVNVTGKQKRLPFKGSGSKYIEFDMETGQGNLLHSSDWEVIAKVLKYVNKKRPDIRFVVIDDNQYLSLFSYTSHMNEKDWTKFNIITVNTIALVEILGKMRDDMMIFVMQHIENGASVEGKELIQAKTMGKFVKEKLTYEGLFTTVLLCDKEEKKGGEIEHFFWTRRINSTVKTPEGMFEEQKIPNDLLTVAKAIHEYYS